MGWIVASLLCGAGIQHYAIKKNRAQWSTFDLASKIISTILVVVLWPAIPIVIAIILINKTTNNIGKR